MSTHFSTTHDIPHSPPLDVRSASGSSDQAAMIQARLSEVARRNPTAVLGVLEHWLGPASSAGADSADG